jgi:glycosyltransferase involved in cell wall biosynthesis
LYVDPDDDEAMAHAISQVLRGAEGREERIRRSRDYIRRFQGNDVAGQVADLYRSLL